MYSLSQQPSDFRARFEGQEEGFESYEQYDYKEYNCGGPRIWCVDPFAKEEEEDGGPLTLERYFQQRDAHKARLAEKARKEREIQRLNENRQKWNRPLSPQSDENLNNPLASEDSHLFKQNDSADNRLKLEGISHFQSDEKSINSPLKSNANPLLRELPQAPSLLQNLQSNEKSTNLPPKSNVNPLLNELPQDPLPPQNFQSDEKSNNPPLKSDGNPLKNFNQPSELKFIPLQVQSSNSQSDESFCDPSEESNINSPLDKLAQNLTQSSINSPLDKLAQNLTQSSDVQLDEQLKINPIKNLGLISALKNETSHPLKSFEQTSLSSFIFNLLLKIKCGADLQLLAIFRKISRHPPGMNRFKPP